MELEQGYSEQGLLRSNGCMMQGLVHWTLCPAFELGLNTAIRHHGTVGSPKRQEMLELIADAIVLEVEILFEPPENRNC